MNNAYYNLLHFPHQCNTYLYTLSAGPSTTSISTIIIYLHVYGIYFYGFVCWFLRIDDDDEDDVDDDNE